MTLIKDLIDTHDKQKLMNKLGLKVRVRSKYLKQKAGYILGNCKNAKNNLWYLDMLNNKYLFSTLI